MKEGTLYCEHCGEDIHIVPDFEPEIEYNMEQTLHDIAREMTPEEDATDDQDVQQSMTELQDWDEEPLENTAKHPFRWKFIVLILVLAVVAVVCTGFGISYSHYHSAEYQIKSAREYVASGEYDQAITCYERALEIDPGNITAYGTAYSYTRRGYWFLKAFQNAELPAYAVPCRRCLSEDVDIF
jgi:tetratricopeptide (TPR) repeat protein